MADAETKRQLKIKTGIVKRIVQELGMYKKELTDQEARIEKMRADGKDEYDIRKQEEVLSETAMMIPDTRSRLENGHEELTEYLVRGQHVSLATRRGRIAQGDPDVIALGDEDELVLAAQKMLANATAALGESEPAAER